MKPDPARLLHDMACHDCLNPGASLLDRRRVALRTHIASLLTAADAHLQGGVEGALRFVGGELLKLADKCHTCPPSRQRR